MQHEATAPDDGVIDFTPRFSYHEVHFVEVGPLATAPSCAAFSGHRVGNIAVLDRPAQPQDAAGRNRVGFFTSSSDTLNAIYQQSLWTKANLVTGGMSVDCPHRERLGYIGDAHTTLETSLQNFASGAFYTKWLQDITDIQG